MDTIIMVWAILGFFAFLNVLSLQDKVSKLERRIRLLEEDETPSARIDLGGKMPEYIGKCIIPEFYEDEEDADIDVTLTSKNGRVTVVECDDKWVKVRLENGKKICEKLLRIHSIKTVAAVDAER